MKKMLYAVLAMALSACLLFSGCGWGGAAVPNPPYSIPGWLSEKEEDAKLREENTQKKKQEIQVDFFYDNTQSMDGYMDIQTVPWCGRWPLSGTLTGNIPRRSIPCSLMTAMY